MNEKEYIQCLKIMDNLLSHPCTGPFRDPPGDIKGYKEVIKNPQDLGTIFKRLKDKKYSKLELWKHDVNLVWKNAIVFNREGPYHDLAKFAKDYFNKLYDKTLGMNLDKIIENMQNKSKKLDELLSSGPMDVIPDLIPLTELTPQTKQLQNNLLDEVQQGLMEFTDPNSQREIFSILRMYNVKLGGSPIITNTKNSNFKVEIDLKKLSTKALESIKELIDRKKLEKKFL